jgi:hypothetical protein
VKSQLQLDNVLIEPLSYHSLIVIDQTNQQSLTKPAQSNPIEIQTNHVSVHATHDHEHDCCDNLHSTEVVHIPHEAQLSHIVEYPLYGRSTLTHLCSARLGNHYKAFQWLFLACAYPLKFHRKCKHLTSYQRPPYVMWFTRVPIPFSTHHQPNGP